MTTSREANFDGLVGPTHNYAGLSFGNVASHKNVGSVAEPRAAALQGLEKMKKLADMGLDQGILPPQERPHVPTLRRLGFYGTDAEVIERAYREAPALLRISSSASSMWTANAATVAPSADTPDSRVHFTPANLVAKAHRSFEPFQTRDTLRAIFADTTHFCVHEPLPLTDDLGDEGAANHTRLAASHHEAGTHLFVFGRRAFGGDGVQPTRYPARQSLEASRSVARLHGLSDTQCVFAQQNPDVIDAGVFHNDVISVGNERALLYHELAFRNTEAVLGALAERVPGFVPIVVPTEEVPVADAVSSYLFNTQLLTMPDGTMHIVAPTECENTATARSALARIVAEDNPITRVHFFDLRQSMRNGGGPACLRLRVVLNDAERASVNPGAWMTESRFKQLSDWVTKHYRERLPPADLADPQLLVESRRALDELTQIMGVGSLYEFQRAGG